MSGVSLMYLQFSPLVSTKLGILYLCPQSRAECTTQVVSLAAWKVFVLQFTGGNDPMEPVLSPLGGSISPN